MPKLLTRKKTRKPVPPCGRVIEYHAPHSPFQKLIDGRRAELGLSYADLAAPLDANRATVWIWLHNANGFPHPKSFKSKYPALLARLLKIKEDDILNALDRSRHLYTRREAIPLPQSKDALATLIGVLENHKAVRVKVSYVLNIARRLRAGQEAASKPPPET